GKECNKHFPSRIELIAQYDDTFLRQRTAIKLLKKYLPSTGDIKIIVKGNMLPKTREELDDFKGVDYYYNTLNGTQCDNNTENIVMVNFKVKVVDCFDCKRFESLIEKTYAPAIELSSQNKETADVLKEENYTICEVPHFVEKVTLKTMNMSNNKQIEFPFRYGMVKTLRILFSSMINTSDNFNCLTKTSFLHCNSITITMTNTKVLNSCNFDKCCNMKIIATNAQVQCIDIKNSCNILINAHIDNIQTVTILSSKKCTFKSTSFVNTFTRIENCSLLHFNRVLEDDTTDISPFEFCGVSVDKFHLLTNLVMEYPSNSFNQMIAINNPEKYNWINKMYSETKQVKVMNGIVKSVRPFNFFDRISYITSTNFCNKPNNIHFVYTKKGKVNIITCNIYYYEVIIKHKSEMSIGIFDSNELISTSNEHIGFIDNSIGYHSSSGCIHNGLYTPVTQVIPYAQQDDQNEVIGCGYYPTTKVVFFTYNGKLVYHQVFDIPSVSSGISMSVFTTFHINYGETEFKFDIYSRWSGKLDAFFTP
ncbi:SPRY domain containing protein, partial [Entamoeba invadens IP1]